MSDLISRADAIEAVCSDCSTQDKIWCKRTRGCCDDVRRIKELPSADAVQGEWKHKPSNSGAWVWWQCSECGAVIYSESEVDRKIHHAYCGVCGARMKGGDDNNA